STVNVSVICTDPASSESSGPFVILTCSGMPMKVVMKVTVPSGLRIGLSKPVVCPAAFSDSDLPFKATNVCRKLELSEKVPSEWGVNRSTTWIVEVPSKPQMLSGKVSVNIARSGAAATAVAGQRTRKTPRPASRKSSLRIASPLSGSVRMWKRPRVNLQRALVAPPFAPQLAAEIGTAWRLRSPRMDETKERACTAVLVACGHTRTARLHCQLRRLLRREKRHTFVVRVDAIALNAARERCRELLRVPLTLSE